MIQMTYREFVRHVRRAYTRLPADVHRRLDNVDIVVEEWPGPDDMELLEEHDTLFGLYQGWPLTEREGIGGPLPDRIVIYRQPILRACETREEAAKEIRITLWHEVGHFLGMNEEDLHRMGYG